MRRALITAVLPVVVVAGAAVFAVGNEPRRPPRVSLTPLRSGVGQ